nr:MAG TPA: hypothetical protein [Caudoviricetes sp.]
MITTAHAAEIPQEIQYSARLDGMADVWMRRNIVQAPYLSDDENLSGGMEYVYDEVFFRTKDTQGQIESDPDTYWLQGQNWMPDVPMTKEEQQEKKIAELEEKLKQARTDSDMAIAELTIVLAAMVPQSTE